MKRFTEYTNLQKIKFLTDNNEINMAAKWLYIIKSESSRQCYTKVAETLFGNGKISDLLGDIPRYDTEKIYFYDSVRDMKQVTSEGFYREYKNLLETIKVPNENALKKRARQLMKMAKIVTSPKLRLYKYLYSSAYENYTLNDFRQCFSHDRDKEQLKDMFLNYIENTELNKKKQSKRYSVSRDMDKDAYYITNEGKLAKIRRWSYLKHRKKCNIASDRRAVKVIEDGIIIKPMKLINKIMPKAHENMKLMLASLFEGIKECKMVIDTDFKKAYDPYYQNHQDTDGDKASNYSCMSGEGDRAQDFYGQIHGCKVVRWETTDGEQVGRCIMYEWNGKRHFIRIYGEYPYHRTMINMLEAQMKPGDMFGRNCCFDDIKLETTMDESTNVMYLDGRYYGIKEINGKWYMVAHKYELDCKTTDGDSIEDLTMNTNVCDYCGCRHDEDNSVWIGDHCYCSDECAEEAGWRCCHNCDEWQHEDDSIYIDGHYYCCDECARNAGYAYDDYNSDWVSEDDIGATDDGCYMTTRDGAADYYGVEESEVEWDSDNSCWKRPAQEENEENNETNEQ